MSRKLWGCHGPIVFLLARVGRNPVSGTNSRRNESDSVVTSTLLLKGAGHLPMPKPSGLRGGPVISLGRILFKEAMVAVEWNEHDRGKNEFGNVCREQHNEKASSRSHGFIVSGCSF